MLSVTRRTLGAFRNLPATREQMAKAPVTTTTCSGPLVAEASSQVRRRGLERPPGYPGPGPQPGNPGVISVRIAPDRPNRPGMRTIWTHRTIWMLPRMLPRIEAIARRIVGRAHDHAW